MSQQQTLLRIETNIPHATITGATKSEFLDTYTDIPIKINKSINEIQDVAKRNSDYSIGLSLPGSKKNNRFFETYYNVDATSLYFNATKRVNCEVLIGSQVYFRGYMRLNKVSVLNSKVEYDVTLYSVVGDLFGQIGNGLLKDLNFDDAEYTFNHTFSFTAVGDRLAGSNFFRDSKYPFTYFYPLVHSGYNYETISGTTLPNFTGATLNRTRLYTTTSPIGWWSGNTAAYAAGVQEYYANSPTQSLYDNQFKPALNIYSLFQLIFKTYGYKISSDFFNTPWFKSMYLYGYFSSEATKFSYVLTNIETLPLDGVELLPYVTNSGQTVNTFLVKKGTGIPCHCLSDVNATLLFNPIPLYFDGFTIPAGQSGYEVTVSGRTFLEVQSTEVGIAPQSAFTYLPKKVGESVSFIDGDFVNFNLVIDQNIKQIDLLSSIAKKFNLVFIPDEFDPTTIKIEPFDFYVGSGNIYDWTPKLSFDKGFTVEPALNYIESQLTLTDLEDGDEGNRIFKLQNNRIYGQNFVYNPTDFKSEEKKIETIFSPELIRKWDNNVGLPLGINYSASNEQSTSDNQIRWLYKGVKSKPKIFFWLMGLNPFIDSVGEVYDAGLSGVDTYSFKLQNSTGGTASSYDRIPSISHTMPIGLADQYKINNDSLCLLFNSELPVDIGVQTYDVYTENDIYNIFYNNRITNIYDPNTRMLIGNFDLKYSDVQNLKWNDIIKINEQYFIVNKINEFNLTNKELTKVELLQFNVNPQQYPERYFAYYYCNDPSVCYKLKTNFTNENLLDTNYIFSLYYDNQVGSLTGSTTGFTSSFRVYDPIFDTVKYYPYTMYEITKDEYDNGSCLPSSNDALLNSIYSNPNGLQFSLAGFWTNLGYTKTGINVWESCADFFNTASTYLIATGGTAPRANYLNGELVFVGDRVVTTGATTYQSTNYGATFALNSFITAQNLNVRAVNSNGSIILAEKNSTQLYISYDSGITFVAGPAGFSVVWDATMSNSGKYMAIAANFSIYVSSNYGFSWSPTSIPAAGYKGVSMSLDGKYLLAAAEGGSNPGLYVSTDYGATWTLKASGNYYSASVSDTGQYMTGGRQGASQNVYVSNDTGSTFTSTSLSSFDQTYVRISKTGQYQYASLNDGGSNWKVFRSTNYGSTWTSIYSGTTPRYVQAVSYDGQYVYYSTLAAVFRSSNYGVSYSNIGLATAIQGYFIGAIKA